MKIYVPIYEGKRTFIEIESKETRFMKFSPYYEDLFYRGLSISAANLFLSEEGVWAYWNRNYRKERELRVDPEKVEWKTVEKHF